jgi:hypothetical protein
MELMRQRHPAPVPFPVLFPVPASRGRSTVVRGLPAEWRAAFHGVLVVCGGAAAPGVCGWRVTGFLIKA